MSEAPSVDVSAVGDLLREVGAQVVLPRFRALEEDEVYAKGVDDVVTAADHEAEQLVTEALRARYPALPMLGEEAAARDDGLAERVLSAETCWVLDPVDGTSNFVAGKADFGMMLALVHRREPVASWIWLPAHEQLFVAERGAGAYRDGVRLTGRGAVDDPMQARGWVFRKHLPPEVRREVEAGSPAFLEVGLGPHAAAVVYARLAEGQVDFVLYWRTNPWDHLPGALLVREAGGAARRPGGEDYRADADTGGLLATAAAASWPLVCTTLLGEEGAG